MEGSVSYGKQIYGKRRRVDRIFNFAYLRAYGMLRVCSHVSSYHHSGKKSEVFLNIHSEFEYSFRISKIAFRVLTSKSVIFDIC